MSFLHGFQSSAMKDEPDITPDTEKEAAKRPLVVPLEESDHVKLAEIGKKYGLQKATYARLIIMAAMQNPERFAPALVAQGG